MPVQVQGGGGGTAPTHLQIGPINPRGSPGIHLTRGWMGIGAGIGDRKISPPQGFDSRAVQHVASRCIDYAIPTAIGTVACMFNTFEGWNFNSGNYLFTTDTK